MILTEIKDDYQKVLRAWRLTDDPLFWRTINELHASQVKRDGDAWLRAQGGRR